MSKREFDDLKTLNAPLVLDVRIHFRRKPSEKAKNAMHPNIDEQGMKAKKVKASDVLHQFVKVHVQSNCSLRENKSELEDSINFSTFSVFVGIEDMKSFICMFDTFRLIVLSEIDKVNKSRALNNDKRLLVVDRKAYMFIAKTQASKQITGEPIASTEALIACISNSKRPFLELLSWATL